MRISLTHLIRFVYFGLNIYYVCKIVCKPYTFLLRQLYLQVELRRTVRSREHISVTDDRSTTSVGNVRVDLSIHSLKVMIVRIILTYL